MAFDWKKEWFIYTGDSRGLVPSDSHPYPEVFRRRGAKALSVYGPQKSTWNVAVLVFENQLGRRKKPGYHIHHIDRDYRNNSPCNLQELTPDQHREVHRFAEMVQPRLINDYVSKKKQVRGNHPGKWLVYGRRKEKLYGAGPFNSESESEEIRAYLEKNLNPEWLSVSPSAVETGLRIGGKSVDITEFVVNRLLASKSV